MMMMTSVEEAQGRIGMEMRAVNLDAHRAGEWAEIVAITTIGGVPCYAVLWPDGESWSWSIDNTVVDFQFRGVNQVFEADDPELEGELKLPAWPETTPEHHPEHTWELRHQLNRHGLADGKTMRTECSCTWRGKWVGSPPEALAQWEEHLQHVLGEF